MATYLPIHPTHHDPWVYTQKEMGETRQDDELISDREQDILAVDELMKLVPKVRWRLEGHIQPDDPDEYEERARWKAPEPVTRRNYLLGEWVESGFGSSPEPDWVERGDILHYWNSVFRVLKDFGT